jgi:hypothetical protein
MRCVVVVVCDDTVMLVSCQPVVMLRMIVVVVNVSVQQGHCPRRRNERRNEQERQEAVHNESLRDEGDWGQKPRDTTDGFEALVPRSARSFYTVRVFTWRQAQPPLACERPA